ncbi:hypothetical protein NKH90_34325 [Mesorhizobium sp. M0898]
MVDPGTRRIVKVIQ